MTQNLLLYTIALSYLYRNRISKEHALLEKFVDAEQAWKHIEEKGMTDALERAKKEMVFIEKHNIEVLYYKSDHYPWRLLACPDAPILLYCKGNINLNAGHFVSVVGTRTPDERGRQQTRNFIIDLCQKVPNLTIVSGLAYGIDVCAHRTAIELGIPTIIIPGHGLDKIYPSVHRQVAIDSLVNGGIVTEFVSETKPDRQNFILRNRIIAGLADAVIIAESKEKGGSLITARCANDYNREVFAFPGRVQDENAKGCNQLIKKNIALLLETADDVIEMMRWEKKVEEPKLAFRHNNEDLSPQENDILTIICQYEDGIHINDIVEVSRIAYSELMPMLLSLEFKQRIKVLPGNVYIRI